MKVLFEGLTEEDIKTIIGFGPHVREVTRLIASEADTGNCNDCSNCGNCGNCGHCMACKPQCM